jgi:hypothetical protein
MPEKGILFFNYENRITSVLNDGDAGLGWRKIFIDLCNE